MRIGQGFDVHALVVGRALIIGGVTIPYGRGLEGHSDADVLLHAVCDALIGAAGLGDIGVHFPDTDPRHHGADSRGLLREVGQLLDRSGWRVVNVDATVIAQAPRMAPHIGRMRDNIASDLGLTASAVNVKAKSSEKLGFIGRGEGIAAEAVALITWKDAEPVRPSD
jgi:2-C-methyl-D-erythritol 2,4-cyclodiphosphate synthase